MEDFGFMCMCILGDPPVCSACREEAALFFPARSGIRFPQNGCISCSHLGLCLGKQDLVDLKLIRRPGGDLGRLDQLDF